jgi:hypothetical protein
MTMLLRTTLLAALVLALGAGSAQAARDQVTYFEAPRDLLDASTREASLDEIAGLGADHLRVVLTWRRVAPAAESRVKPNFDATDPAAYTFGDYDAIIDGARARGMKVLMTVTGPVPRWATNGARDNYTRPSPAEFRRFSTAVARRFGSRVSTFSVWNEPNQPQFLRPQFDSRGRPASPKIYRGLYQAGTRGLREGGAGATPVLLGETSPIGTGNVVAPITFLRGMLCLNPEYKRAKKCGKLDADGYAHHAYTPKAGPTFVPSSPNAVTIGVLSRLTRALDRAGRAGAIRRRMPLHLTEFGIQSVPDPLVGVSLARQEEFRAFSERLAYYNPRVRSFSQYLLRDADPIKGVPKLQRYPGFESGLRLANGKAKPSLAGFRLTLVAKGRGSRPTLWGLVRPAPGPTTATVEVADRGGAFRRLTSVRTDARGYFTRRVSGRDGRRWRLRWTTDAGRVVRGAPIRALR